MITREYKCPECGIIEVQSSMSDECIKICPKCGREVNRYFEPTAHSWKTSGHCGKGFMTTGKRLI